MLRLCCDLKRGPNHKSRDLKVRFGPLFTAICGKILRFGIRDLKSLAICDLEHLERVEELGTQIVKWNNRLPDLNDENDEKVPTAIEVQEALDTLADTSFRKFQSIFNRIHTLEGMVGT